MSDRLLVILDLSWWLTRAWELGRDAHPAETAADHALAGRKMVATITGWLVRLLSAPMPACFVAALDSVGPTWRHELTAELPVERRYKAKRAKRPTGYRVAKNVCLEIFRAHSIQLLSAEGFEADDVIATATRLARDLELDVAIVSADKDLACLVGEHVWQWPWGGGEKGLYELRGPAQILERYGVLPELMTEWLAVSGDRSDGVRGIDGIGTDRAALVLHAMSLLPGKGSPLDRALEAELRTAYPLEVKAQEKVVATLKRAKVNAFSVEAPEKHAADVTQAEARLQALRGSRDLCKWIAKIQASREDVLLARGLVTLDADAPIQWEPSELPVGGFDVEALRVIYGKLGFTALQRDVVGFAKRRL